MPGNIITLETYVTSNGGETDNTIFGAIEYPNALVDPYPAGSSQVQLLSTTGALTCTTVFCVAFSQINVTGPIAVNVTNFLIATTTFMIDPSAPISTIYQFNWRTSPSTQRLDWFGLSNAPGVSFTIIPEPATAALLGVGLLGLGLGLAARRQRA